MGKEERVEEFYDEQTVFGVSIQPHICTFGLTGVWCTIVYLVHHSLGRVFIIKFVDHVILVIFLIFLIWLLTIPLQIICYMFELSYVIKGNRQIPFLK